MAQLPTTNWDLAVVLPLGLVARELLKIESQLRELNLKALGRCGHGEQGAFPARQVGERLEELGVTLEAIGALVTDLRADLRPRASQARDD